MDPPHREDGMLFTLKMSNMYSNSNQSLHTCIQSIGTENYAIRKDSIKALAIFFCKLFEKPWKRKCACAYVVEVITELCNVLDSYRTQKLSAS